MCRRYPSSYSRDLDTSYRRHPNFGVTIYKLNPTASAGEDGSSPSRIFDLDIPDYTQVLWLSSYEHFLLWMVFSIPSLQVPGKNSQGFLPPLDLVFTSSQSWVSLGAFPCPRAAEGMRHFAAALPVTPARAVMECHGAHGEIKSRGSKSERF